MGATNKTPKLELPLFIDSDKPSWRGDFNDAMTKLDTGLSSYDTKIDTAQNMAANAQATANTASTKVDGVAETVQNQANDISNNSAAIKTNQNSINTLNTRVTTNTDSITGLTTSVNQAITDAANASRDVNQLRSTVEGHSVTITDLSSRMTMAESKIVNNTNAINDVSDKVRDLRWQNVGGSLSAGWAIEKTVQFRTIGSMCYFRGQIRRTQGNIAVGTSTPLSGMITRLRPSADTPITLAYDHGDLTAMVTTAGNLVLYCIEESSSWPTFFGSYVIG